mgnify:CR=1 FL=1
MRRPAALRVDLSDLLTADPIATDALRRVRRGGRWRWRHTALPAGQDRDSASGSTKSADRSSGCPECCVGSKLYRGPSAVVASVRSLPSRATKRTARPLHCSCYRPPSLRSSTHGDLRPAQDEAKSSVARALRMKPLSALVLLAGIPRAAFAQAAIAGSVTDPSDAPIPGVLVEASSPCAHREGSHRRHRWQRPVPDRRLATGHL